MIDILCSLARFDELNTERKNLILFNTELSNLDSGWQQQLADGDNI